jgi:hypothetical protein
MLASLQVSSIVGAPHCETLWSIAHRNLGK